MPSRIAATRALVIASLFFGVILAGCGDKTVTDTDASGNVTTTTVPNVHFPKTKFLLHSGLAFGAFHRYIYNPFKAGSFSAGADGRTKALVKAGIAAAFVSHELKEAHDSALSSDVLRRHVISKLDALVAKVKALPGALKVGSFDPASIVGVAGAIGALKSVSSSNGADIGDKFAPVPGL